ncbi:hypothetical protein Tco_1458825 [Tanacetum coccineum]
MKKSSRSKASRPRRAAARNALSFFSRISGKAFEGEGDVLEGNSSQSKEILSEDLSSHQDNPKRRLVFRLPNRDSSKRELVGPSSTTPHHDIDKSSKNFSSINGNVFSVFLLTPTRNGDGIMISDESTSDVPNGKISRMPLSDARGDKTISSDIQGPQEPDSRDKMFKKVYRRSKSTRSRTSVGMNGGGMEASTSNANSINLEYATHPGSAEGCCKMTLQFEDPSSNVVGKTFKLTLREVTGFPGFLVERSKYDAAMKETGGAVISAKFGGKIKGSGNSWDGYKLLALSWGQTPRLDSGVRVSIHGLSENWAEVRPLSDKGFAVIVFYGRGSPFADVAWSAEGLSHPSYFSQSMPARDWA